MSVTHPINLEEMRQYVFTRLGYPVINVELAPEQVDVIIADTVQDYQKYAYGEGIDLVNASLKKFTPDKEFLYDYQYLLKELGYKEESITVNHSILNKYPSDITAINSLCSFYFKKRELYIPYRAICKALKADPGNLSILKHKANAFMLAERYSDALETLNLCITIQPSDEGVLEMLAESYYRIGDEAAGLSIFKKLCSITSQMEVMERAIIVSMMYGQLVEAELFSRQLLSMASKPDDIENAKLLSKQLRYLHIADTYKPFPVNTNTDTPYDIAFIGYNGLRENGGGHQPPQIARCLSSQGHRVFYAQSYDFMLEEREPFAIFDDPFLKTAFSPATQYIKNKYKAVVANAFPQTGYARKKLLVLTGTSVYLNSLIPTFKEMGFTVVYWCIDDFQGINGELSPRIVERWLAQNSHATLATASGLAEKLHNDTGKFVPVISNGFSTKNFPTNCQPVPVPDDMITGEKTFVYWGGIGLPWINWTFMYQVMTAHPEWAFNFIGPKTLINADKYRYLMKCRELSNSNFTGTKNVNDLYAYGVNSDIGLVHFNAHKAAKSMNHVKVYEYLACNLPVVALPCRQLGGVPGVTQVINLQQFEQAVANYENTPLNRNEILTYLDEKTWDARATQFLEYANTIIK